MICSRIWKSRGLMIPVLMLKDPMHVQRQNILPPYRLGICYRLINKITKILFTTYEKKSRANLANMLMMWGRQECRRRALQLSQLDSLGQQDSCGIVTAGVLLEDCQTRKNIFPIVRSFIKCTVGNTSTFVGFLTHHTSYSRSTYNLQMCCITV
jgi:hypothetical protein